MNFLKKLQALPEAERKIILWVVVVAVGLGLLFAWGSYVKRQSQQFQKEEFLKKLPPFGEELKNLPNFEMPNIEVPEPSEEELKQLEEMMKEQNNQI